MVWKNSGPGCVPCWTAPNSGKSFLLSGLQGGLGLVQVPGGGLSGDKYVGPLPSSPVPTTACPARVVPDMGFIGEGFIPVSPALEAKSVRLAEEGRDAEAAQYRAEGRMDLLRQSLTDLISRETGPRHIAAVAEEARALIRPRYQALRARLESERLPVDQLTGMLQSQRDRLAFLDAETPRLREELERTLHDRVNRAARPFIRLEAHLHGTLDERIRSTDVRKPARANQVQVAKTQLIQSWMDAASGPATLWADLLAEFKTDILRKVNRMLGESDPAGRLPDYTFDARDLTVPAPQRRRTTSQDVIQRTAAVVGVAAPVAPGAQGMDLLDNLEDNLALYCERLEQSVAQLMERIDQSRPGVTPSGRNAPPVRGRAPPTP
ncbi:hypothetical protein AB0M28_25220 [Streptomyces sp. NPDC051940]|uniref:hypothetical protein n=1 Tax=Streptomyces sp. NPDC051940 TaxID=3155675 RepID=UPI00341379B4